MKLKRSTRDTLNRLWAASEKLAAEPEIIPDTMPDRCYIRPVNSSNDVNCDFVERKKGFYVGGNWGKIKDLNQFEWSLNLRVWKPCVS